MKRRETLKLFGAAAVAAAIGVAGIPGLSFAQDQKKMVTVVKISGIPWFNALENGVKKAGTDFGIDASVVGPANFDPAQQVKLLEDLIAQKVDVIGLVPIDVKVAEPVLKRAQEAGIPVITHEGPEQEGGTWNVELIDSVDVTKCSVTALFTPCSGSLLFQTSFAVQSRCKDHSFTNRLGGYYVTRLPHWRPSDLGCFQSSAAHDLL
jgi:ABC-type sugar transport system substrate-binding protein